MQDTVLPLQFPVKDVQTGKEIREIFVQKGTSVYIGLGATNRSTALWGEDAADFKPERWMGHHAHESTVEQIKTPGIFSNMCVFVVSLVLQNLTFESQDDFLGRRTRMPVSIDLFSSAC